MGQSGCPTTAQEAMASTTTLDTAPAQPRGLHRLHGDRQNLLMLPSGPWLTHVGSTWGYELPSQPEENQTGPVINMMVQGRTQDAQS